MLIPSAHTSLFRHPSSSYTSGAMYNEVPHVVLRLEDACSSCTAKPKSPVFTTPVSERNTLSGLMSYPSTSLFHPYSMNDHLVVEILQTQQNATNHFSQLAFCESFAIPQVRSNGSTATVLHHNLLHHAIQTSLTHNSLSPWKALWYLTMKGDSHFFSICDSLSISLSSRVTLTFLMATTLPVFLSSAAYTSPKRLQVNHPIQHNPSPILPLISKSLLEQPLIEMESMRKKKVRKGDRCSLFTYLYQFVSHLVNTLTAFFPSSSSQSDDWFLVSRASSSLLD